MPILSIAIQKGGSGKTTTAINLGAALRQLGHSVLLVDLDPQANLTQALGFSAEPEPNLYDLFKRDLDGEELKLDECIREANELHLIPATLELANAEMELISVYGRERILARILESPAQQYDWVILDCPPAVGMLTTNALVASQYVLLPLQAEYLPFKGVQSFMRTYEKIQRQLNPHLELLGIVLTRYNARLTINRNTLEKLEQAYGDKVLQTRIRPNTALAKAQEWGADIFSYDNTAPGAYDYLQLAHELLNRSQTP